MANQSFRLRQYDWKRSSSAKFVDHHGEATEASDDEVAASAASVGCFCKLRVL